MNLSNKINELPHNCGLVALRHFHKDIPEEEFIFAFNCFCHLWPRGGVKDDEMFKVMDYLRISKSYIWTNCIDKNVRVKDLFNGKKYMVLIKGHYLVVDNCKMIYGYSSTSEVICYWEWNMLKDAQDSAQSNQSIFHRAIMHLKKFFRRFFQLLISF